MKRVLVLVLAGVLVGGWYLRLVPQTPDPVAFSERSQAALEEALSATATSSTVLLGLQRGDLPTAYARVTLRSSAQAVGEAGSSYGELFPPRGSDELAESTGLLLSQAQDAVQAARLAVARQDRSAYPERLNELRQVAGRLRSSSTALEAAGG